MARDEAFLIFFFSCSLAGVEVRDGGTENSALIDTFCQNKPPTQKSTDNSMYIKYYTNSPNPNNGFKANVKIGNAIAAVDLKLWNRESNLK